MATLLRLFALGTLLAAARAVAQTKAEPPVPVRTVAPEYPLQLRREGVTGVVTVKCTVDEQGNVVATEVVRSTHEDFEKPAMVAVQKWKFKPAKQDGVPIAMKVSIPIKFVQES